MSSASTRTPTSMEELKVRLTIAATMTTIPSRQGFKKCTESTEAVTHGRRASDFADMPAHRSIHFSTCPPKHTPTASTSWGITISCITTRVAPIGTGKLCGTAGGAAGRTSGACVCTAAACSSPWLCGCACGPGAVTPAPDADADASLLPRSRSTSASRACSRSFSSLISSSTADDMAAAPPSPTASQSRIASQGNCHSKGRPLLARPDAQLLKPPEHASASASPQRRQERRPLGAPPSAA
mmetsp:Transcript_23703/g.70320  ORF Transcript_23703/g.70320 Transcript_23703/m.70320 type:complete len:241 (+) Transcript_23703:141-863(+)